MNLVPVSPPTDWTGILIVCAFGLVVAVLIGYIVYIRRTPGAQLGEEQLERLAELIVSKRNGQNPPQPLPLPRIEHDGFIFSNQVKLDEYKAAKAIVDAAQSQSKGTP